MVLIGLLLAGPALAGCFGGSSGGPQRLAPGGAAGQLSGVPTDLLTERGRGAIHGFVLNPEGAWVSGAHVLIVGGTFATSDAQGQFQFPNLVPGTHTLRATADDYLPIEQDVRVEADLVTRIDLVLPPASNLGKDFRQHFHDFWSNATEKPLLDKSLRWPPSVAEGGKDASVCIDTTHMLRDGDSFGGGVPSSTQQQAAPAIGTCWIDFFLDDLPDDDNDEEEIVWPGTKEIRVTIDWKRDQPLVPRARLFYKAANGQNFGGPLSFSPGDTQTIQVSNRNMTDHGHQVYSLWRFRLEVDVRAAGVVPLPEQGDLIRRVVGDFDVDMVAVKGLLWPEDPHPRFWANGPRLVLTGGGDPYRVVDGPLVDRDPTLTTHAETDSSSGGGDATGPESIGFGTADKIVPPGTTKLEVSLDYWSNTTAVPPSVLDLDEHFSEKRLVFRTGATNPRLATLDNVKVIEPATSARPQDGAPGQVIWSLPLEAVDTDAFYQKTSLWLYLLANLGKERDPKFTNECTKTADEVCDGGYYRLTVVAVNENWERERAAGRI